MYKYELTLYISGYHNLFNKQIECLLIALHMLNLYRNWMITIEKKEENIIEINAWKIAFESFAHKNFMAGWISRGTSLFEIGCWNVCYYASMQFWRSHEKRINYDAKYYIWDAKTMFNWILGHYPTKQKRNIWV